MNIIPITHWIKRMSAKCTRERQGNVQGSMWMKHELDECVKEMLRIYEECLKGKKYPKGSGRSINYKSVAHAD